MSRLSPECYGRGRTLMREARLRDAMAPCDYMGVTKENAAYTRTEYVAIVEHLIMYVGALTGGLDSTDKMLGSPRRSATSIHLTWSWTHRNSRPLWSTITASVKSTETTGACSQPRLSTTATLSYTLLAPQPRMSSTTAQSFAPWFGDWTHDTELRGCDRRRRWTR
jgi:hypothetical protein